MSVASHLNITPKQYDVKIRTLIPLYDELIAEAASDPRVGPAFPVEEQDPEKLIESGLCVGTPDEVRRAVAKYQAVGVDVLGLVPRTSWIEPQEVVLRSLATTGRSVLPAFRS